MYVLLWENETMDFLTKIQNANIFFFLSLHLNTPVAWRPNVSTTGGQNAQIFNLFCKNNNNNQNKRKKQIKIIIHTRYLTMTNGVCKYSHIYLK